MVLQLRCQSCENKAAVILSICPQSPAIRYTREAATELPNTITDEDLKPGIDQVYKTVAISPDRIAETVAFAIDTPVDTSTNEILVRPTIQQG